MKRLLVILLTTLVCTNVWSWGARGHRIITEVAYHCMDAKTRKWVDSLLGEHGAIYWCTWPDELKSDTIYPDSYDWHFQDLDAGLSDSAVVSVLNGSFTSGGRLYHKLDSLFIALKHQPKDKDALVFVVHLMGDQQCPMHIARLEDRGGNEVKVKWMGRKSNLHKVWDDDLILFRDFSYTEYAELLINRYDSRVEEAREVDDATMLLRNYRLTQSIYDYQSTWDGNVYHYVYHWKETLEWQLYVAGVRLAMRLNEGMYYKSR